MSRFLFVVPPLVGHINPTVSVGRHLLDRGHQVAWVGHPRRVRPLLFEAAQLIELDDSISEEDLQALTEKSNRVRGLEGMKFLWEEFLVPLSRAMLPGVEQSIDSFQPDVLVADQQAIAEEEIVIVVQVNGKLRDRLLVPVSSEEEEIKEMALISPKVRRHIDGKEVKKTIFVPQKLVNIVCI